MHNTRVSSLAFLLTGLGVACSAVTTETSTENTSSQSQAVWNRGGDGTPISSADTEGAARNAVVRIPHLQADGTADPNDTGCTGVFITPTLLLTSKYCVSNEKGGIRPLVQIGATRTDFASAGHTRKASLDAAQMATAPVGGVDGGDLAIVTFPPPASDAEAALILPMRPTLANPGFPAPTAGLRAFPKIEMVGWSSYPLTPDDPPPPNGPYIDARQTGTVAPANIGWSTIDSPAAGPFFARAIAPGYDFSVATTGLQAGDEGSPLYYSASTAVGTARLLIGIATTHGNNGFDHITPSGLGIPGCGDSPCDVWVDLTSAAAVAFIAARAQDHAHDAAPNAHWIATHGRPDGHVRPGTSLPDWWLGENDAPFGQHCGATDADCDGWNETAAGRDNCPTTPNPDQKDTDDDGQGDACDSCPNSPGDIDCDGRPDGADNCPTASNWDQADGDGDGVGNACDHCADMEDPANPATCAYTCGNNQFADNDLTAGVHLDHPPPSSGWGYQSGDNYYSKNCGQWIEDWTAHPMGSVWGQKYASTTFHASGRAGATPILQAECKGTEAATLWGRTKAAPHHWVQLENRTGNSHWNTATSPASCAFDDMSFFLSQYYDSYDRFRVSMEANKMATNKSTPYPVDVPVGGYMMTPL